jgi:hypothetical protein
MKRYTQMTVGPDNVPIFDERNFVITIEDEAGGEFLKIQCNDDQCQGGEIRLDTSEWKELKEAIDTMAKACKTYE